MDAVAPIQIPEAVRPELDANTVVLYFGNDWFAENRTSSHHLARQLAKRFKVFYIECPGMRAPRGSGRDLKKLFSKIGMFLRGTRQVEDGIHLRTLFQIPLHRYRLVCWLNKRIIHATLGLMKWRYRVKNPISWFHVPHVSFLVGELGERLAVYYCTDDFAAYPGAHADTVRAMDREAATRADLVFVTSETLLARKRAVNPSTYVSPHGVEFDHFARAQNPEVTIPTDVAHLKGPVVGFFGLIESFIDLDAINWISAQRPDWQFVFLGRVAVRAEALPQRPNVHFLGKKPYAELPAYAKRFDACIIPYRAGDWSYHANPLKLREYLATGKPVVSVDTPQVRKFADLVNVAVNRDEFLAHLDQVLAAPSKPEDIARRMSRVAQASWSARADEVVEAIRNKLRAELAEHSVRNPAVDSHPCNEVRTLATPVFLRRADRTDPLPAIRELMDCCGWRELVPEGGSVVVKPNLCTDRREMIHCANTSLSVLRAVCVVLRERTPNVTIVESDGARYPAEAAFENTGAYKVAAELGCKVLNLSKDTLIDVPDTRMAGFGMSKTWLEADCFITLPVLKTHATTVFTGALKNQWGCIPRFDRILLHKHLHELIVEVNRLRPVTLALMDGLVGMQGRGPINGYPIDMNVLLASRDPVALDASSMRLMGLDPATSKHIVHAEKIGLGTYRAENIAVNGPFGEVATVVEPAIEDWAIKLMNRVSRSPFLTRNLLLKDGIFYPIRRAVNILRSVLRRKRISAAPTVTA